MIATIILWFVHLWDALCIVVARDWAYYVIALPVVGVIAWLTLPCCKPPFGEDEES